MSNYDKRPIIQISDDASLCKAGWDELTATLKEMVKSDGLKIIAVEVYPGIDSGALTRRLQSVSDFSLIVQTEDEFLSPDLLREKFGTSLSDDPVFGFMQPWTMYAYFDEEKFARKRDQVSRAAGKVLIVGPGASLLTERTDLLISANVSRWEIQRRQRTHLITNLGLENQGARPSELYKVAFFLDWRVADRLRHDVYAKVDVFLDLTDEQDPSMLSGDVLREAVSRLVKRPFRVVPFFDPGPWGGQWMKTRFDLPEGTPNYAWGFDCVPEENSVLFGFGDQEFELPAIVLVHEESEALLGGLVLERFGPEFPIRFDFLDTVSGGNLSLQVHPSTAYIRDHFGMPYTQDESYYMLHSEPGSSMYLGLLETASPEVISAALYEANSGGAPFPTDALVAEWQTTTHDHFSIPSGTVHCSGEGNVVLEISATPYIFTFKLWDWGRTGLDGRPRPIHLKHGLANIEWDRKEDWVRRELVGQTTLLAEGDGWREERTGLHVTQFLETRRHWFTKPVTHNTQGNLHVLNLVEGSEAIVSSPISAFEPMTIHYAETFIVPASVGEYTITPVARDGESMATLKAYVRP